MNFPSMGQWVDAQSHETLVEDLFEARTFWQRAVGLQFKRSWDEGKGLLIKNCHAIHTMWMRFPIDVFFLDESFSVVEFHWKLLPWRVLRARDRAAKHTIEIASRERREFSRIRTSIIAKTFCEGPRQ